MANRKQFDITKAVSTYENNEGQEKTVWGNLGRLTLYSETSDIPDDIMVFCELHNHMVAGLDNPVKVFEKKAR